MLTRGRVDLWIYFPHIGYNVSRNMILGSSTFVRYGYLYLLDMWSMSAGSSFPLN